MSFYLLVELYGFYMYNVCMQTIHFERDENKNIINKEKHGVSFEEAKTVFYDEYALLEYDKNNSESEDRFRILGISKMGNVLLVAHCTRENDTIIRIISSRKATPNEKKGYERSRKS